jgi:uncharacterized cupin superfamily protein
MARQILLATPASVELEPEPIPREWILSGTPEARSKNMLRSHDWTANVVVWDCTAGSFTWHYNKDEAILIVSGECFLIQENGEERRFGPGDLGFFPAGTTCKWRVADRVRKVAVLRETMWRPFGFCLKAWNKFLRIVGLAGKSPLALVLAAWTLSRYV